MTSCHLLFVEDSLAQQALFKDAVNDWNIANPEMPFSYHIAGTFDEGLSELALRRYDGALFDLRLPSSVGNGKETVQGNELARIGLHKEGIPVAILSGQTAEADPEFVHSKTVEVFEKSAPDAFDKAIAWFGQQWLMLETLSGARQEIRKRSAALFAERIWPRWKEYRRIADDRAHLTPVLARQFVWHLGEEMGLGGEGHEEWHPLESWICPPLNPHRAATGDVIRLGDELWIVMTPPCDLANDGKVKNVLLAKVSEEGFEGWPALLEKAQTAGRDKAIKSIRKFMNQAEPAQHVLPALPGGANPVVVQFTHLRTESAQDFGAKLGLRVGTVAAPFISNLIQRFGAYISRVGQPNLNIGEMAPVGGVGPGLGGAADAA